MLDEPRTVFRGMGAAAGFVKHAYHLAATLVDYTIVVDPATRRLTLGGTVTTSDPYLLAQTPLVFVVPTKAGRLRWPIKTVHVSDTRVVAELGDLLVEK
jgi:hypothetical protein